MAQTDGGSLALVGIAIFYGAAGCESSYPAGFVRVQSYLTFIQGVIELYQD